VNVGQLLVVDMAPAFKKCAAHAGGAIFGVVVVVFNIRKDNCGGPVVARGKWLVPVSEDVSTGLQDGVL